MIFHYMQLMFIQSQKWRILLNLQILYRLNKLNVECILLQLILITIQLIYHSGFSSPVKVLLTSQRLTSFQIYQSNKLVYIFYHKYIYYTPLERFEARSFVMFKRQLMSRYSDDLERSFGYLEFHKFCIIKHELKVLSMLLHLYSYSSNQSVLQAINSIFSVYQYISKISFLRVNTMPISVFPAIHQMFIIVILLLQPSLVAPLKYLCKFQQLSEVCIKDYINQRPHILIVSNSAAHHRISLFMFLYDIPLSQFPQTRNKNILIVCVLVWQEGDKSESSFGKNCRTQNEPRGQHHIYPTILRTHASKSSPLKVPAAFLISCISTREFLQSYTAKRSSLSEKLFTSVVFWLVWTSNHTMGLYLRLPQICICLIWNQIPPLYLLRERIFYLIFYLVIWFKTHCTMDHLCSHQSVTQFIEVISWPFYQLLRHYSMFSSKQITRLYRQRSGHNKNTLVACSSGTLSKVDASHSQAESKILHNPLIKKPSFSNKAQQEKKRTL